LSNQAFLINLGVQKSIGHIIKQIRTDKQLSLKALAQELNIDLSLLSRFEHDERIPTEEQMLKLCQYFPEHDYLIKVTWLSSKLMSHIQAPYESLALDALQLAEEHIKYNLKKD